MENLNDIYKKKIHKLEKKIQKQKIIIDYLMNQLNKKKKNRKKEKIIKENMIMNQDISNQNLENKSVQFQTNSQNRSTSFYHNQSQSVKFQEMNNIKDQNKNFLMNNRKILDKEDLLSDPRIINLKNKILSQKTDQIMIKNNIKSNQEPKNLNTLNKEDNQDDYFNMVKRYRTNSEFQENQEVIEEPKKILIEEKEDFFACFETNQNNKQNIPLFKMNFKFEEYFKYISKLYVPFINDDSNFNLSKLHVSYIKNNSQSIHKQIFKDINNLDQKLLYTLFYCIGRVLSYENIICIIHDLFIFCNDFNLIFFYSFALFNKYTFKNDVLSDSIKMILSYQGLIMEKEKISNLTQSVVEKMMLFEDFDLKIPLSKIIEMTEYDDKCCAALRIISVFMDWNWTYNFLVVSIFYPKFIETKRSIFLVYLGILLIHGYRNFHDHKSVISIKEFLKKQINSENNFECKIMAACYLKNVDYEFVINWARENIKSVDKRCYKRIKNKIFY